jgi:energy-coupling factor transporter ATP-binding protein EcfA2
MANSPSKTIPALMRNIEFSKGLEADDARYVDTRAARGSEQTLQRVSKRFGIFPGSDEFEPTMSAHLLFMGHTGSGKSTELKRYAEQMRQSRKLYVVEVDISTELDENNLKIEDLLVTLVKALLSQLALADNISIAESEFKELQDWSAERFKVVTQHTDNLLSVQAGVEAKLGLLSVLNIFGKVTADMKSGVTYKEDMRVAIRNHFSRFKQIFTGLLSKVEAATAKADLGKRVLFVIDGTDKLRNEDRKLLFLDESAKLFELPILAIYAASIDFAYTEGIPNTWSQFKLPMIKLHEKDGSTHVAGRQALREMILHRADISMFENEAVLDTLIDHSGGHARDLFTLLKQAFEFVLQGNVMHMTDVQQAIPYFARERAAFMKPEHYTALAQVDADPINCGNPEDINLLLHKLVVLEYNDSSWRTSHPILRGLPGYTRAVAALAKSATATA